MNHQQQPSNSTDPIHSSRRSTHACHRCKTKKLKCSVGQTRSKCAACIKARADCVFDRTPDGVPRGADYVASLEARVAFLESELAVIDLARNRSTGTHDNFDPTQSRVRTHIIASEPARQEVTSLRNGSFANRLSEYSFCELVESAMQKTENDQAASTGKLNILQSGPSTSEVPIIALPSLPSVESAEKLLDRAYMYTQARYCIVDWVKVREWHLRRTDICYAGEQDSTEAQTGAYFLWIVYAIGAGLVNNPEHPSRAYFTRARNYLHVVMAQQNLTTVQGLLCLLQYVFRVNGGPSVWHITGIALRLCIELGCHRKASATANQFDPYTIELRKRFFWCTYCFDRLISAITKRPFGISDLDIDVEPPVNIDILCTDDDTIRELQRIQAGAECEQAQSSLSTTISAALHHLEMYRLKSTVITRLKGPHVAEPTVAELEIYLNAIDEWLSRAPREIPTDFPQQSYEHIRAMYYQTVMLILRPVLVHAPLQADLLVRCAQDATDACENARDLNLSPQSAPSLVGLYQTFICGITLLQCLAINTNIIGRRSALRGIVACSNTLAVYTRLFAGVSSFRELFDKLSDAFLGDRDRDHDLDPDQYGRLRDFLGEVLSSDAAAVPELSRSFSRSVCHQDQQNDVTNVILQQAFPVSDEFGALMELGDYVMPFEMGIEAFPLFS